ncbi:MAG: hypothetical protein ACJASL_004503, partial [Paraglaciecola sp.]
MANLQSLPILLKELRLNTMARSWEEVAHKAIEEQWEPEKYLAALCKIEAGHRHECRLKRLLRDSKLPTGKQLSQYDFNEISGIMLLTSYIGLIIILLASTLASGGEHTVGTNIAAPIVIWLFKCLPLLIFIPGLIKGSHRTASWLAYVTMIYFVLAILL